MNSLQLTARIVDPVNITEGKHGPFAFLKLKVRHRLPMGGQEPYYFLDALVFGHAATALADLELPRKVLIQGSTSSQQKAEGGWQNVVRIDSWGDLGDGGELPQDEMVRDLVLSG